MRTDKRLSDAVSHVFDAVMGSHFLWGQSGNPIHVPWHVICREKAGNVPELS